MFTALVYFRLAEEMKQTHTATHYCLVKAPRFSIFPVWATPRPVGTGGAISSFVDSVVPVYSPRVTVTRLARWQTRTSLALTAARRPHPEQSVPVHG